MKNKQYLILLFILLLLGGGSILFINNDSTTEFEPPEEELSIQDLPIDTLVMKQIDFMEEAFTANSDTSLKFDANFWKGHVQPGKLEDYLTKTEDGYIINLKNKSPILTPTLIDNFIYVPGGFGSKKYYCFNYKSGELKWAINLDDDGPSPAVVSDSLLIFNTESCTIFAINRFTGQMKWSHWLGDPLLSTPIIVGDRVYTAYPNTKMYSDSTLTAKYKKVKPTNPFICLDVKTGKVIWQKWLDGDILISPVSDGQFIYLTTFPGTVYKLNAKDGKILASIGLRATSPPSIEGNRIFITKRSDESKKVKEAIAILNLDDLAFIKEFNSVDAPYLDLKIQSNSNLKSLAELLDSANGFPNGAPQTSGWQLASQNIGQSNVSSLQLFQSSMVSHVSGKIFNIMGNNIYCIDPIKEKTLWKYHIDGDLLKLGGVLATSPVITANSIVTVTIFGEILVLDLETGHVKFEKNLNKTVRSAPVVKEGRIYVPTADGELVCVNTKMDNLDGWNMFLKNSKHQINR